MKKKSFLFFLFFLSSLSMKAYSQAPAPFDDIADFSISEERIILENMKKNDSEFRQNVETLLNRRSHLKQRAEKEKIRVQIKELVLSQTNKELEINKKFADIQAKRLRQIESTIEEVEKNKPKYIERRTDYLIKKYESNNP